MAERKIDPKFNIHESYKKVNIINPYRYSGGGGETPSNPAFVTTWETTTASEGITIDLQNYENDFIVDWGDGNINGYIGTGGSISHIYAVAGRYDVSIEGVFSGCYIYGSPSAPKLKEIKNWGTSEIKSLGRAFLGCSNLIITAQDVLNTNQLTGLSSAFQGCSSIIDIPNINQWNVSGVTSMVFAFRDAQKFNSDISNWDTSNVTSFAIMFRNAYAFNQDISNWNIKQATSFDSFMQGKSSSNFSSENYDALLNSWEAQVPKSGVPLDMGTIKYSSAGAAARQSLIDNYGWSITDGGQI